jgi:orotate phosphoribosyltransferase
MVLNLLPLRQGHFLLESGHHGDRWLDLELLCLRPRLLEPLIGKLAERLGTLGIDSVCGPLVEGAFVGLMIATQLDVEFTYTERTLRPTQDGLFPASYRLPPSLREKVRGKRVAIVNDVVNAGSAVKGTFADLRECGANVIAIGTLLVLGSAAAEFASRIGVVLDSLATLPNFLWTTSACPLCAAGIPLEDIGGFAACLAAKDTGL